MTIKDMFQSISDRVHSTATVKTIYGDPIAAEGKTIIPVARVRYAFGVGGGTHETASGNGGGPHDVGGGGGGGVTVTPVGFIEVTPGETRYVSIDDRRRMIRAGVITAIVGMLLFRRALRRRR
ncbi:MAG: hypothetical protein L0177_20900 [Chloroflexi bacterium]|nr:hypothetical protein [Chloroflexota bacterium]